MNETKMRGLMGLCVRAGQGIFGEDSCLKALRSGQIGLLLLDGSISPTAGEKYASLCRREEIPCQRLPEGLMAQATGKPGKAMAVRKGSFTEQMLQCLESDRAEDSKNRF